MRKLSVKITDVTKEVRIKKNVVKLDAFDKKAFERVLFHNPDITNTYEEGQKDYPQFKELHQDVFDSLYKYAPLKYPDADIDYDYLLNSQIMDEVMKSVKYKELRNLTRLDEIQSTIGTQILGDEVKKLVDELREEFEKQMKEAAGAMQQAQKDADDQLKKKQEEIAAGGGTEEEKAGAESDAQAEKEWTLKEAKKRLEEHMKKHKDKRQRKVRRETGKMLDQAISKTTETSSLITNWGLEQDPSYSTTGYQEKIKLINELKSSDKLKKIAALAGRYRRLALSTMREKVKRGIESLYNIKTGNNLRRLIPTELMKIKHPILKKLFYKGFAEKSLLEYEYRGKERKAKGPIICCIDNSGSMSGEPEVWSKAVAVGLLDLARAQKRPFMVIHFAAERKEDLYTNYFPAKEAYDIRQIIDMATYFSNGGTKFEPALDLSRDTISDKKEFSKSDVIFITDGECAVRDSWLKTFLSWKKSNNVKIYSILIDSWSNSSETLNEFSDSVTHLKDLRQSHADNLAITIFSQM